MFCEPNHRRVQVLRDDEPRDSGRLNVNWKVAILTILGYTEIFIMQVIANWIGAAAIFIDAGGFLMGAFTSKVGWFEDSEGSREETVVFGVTLPETEEVGCIHAQSHMITWNRYGPRFSGCVWASRSCIRPL